MFNASFNGISAISWHKQIRIKSVHLYLIPYYITIFLPPLVERGLYCNHLVRPLVHPSVCPSVHTFVTDILASTGRNDCTSTSCLQCDLEFFMFAVMKTFITVISASTGRNDFIFDIWLWHCDLYRVSPFQVYCASTSCLPCDLQMNEWEYS